MEKPVSIAIEETKGALVNVLNTSGLPISVLKLIVNELNTDVNNAAMTNLRQDIQKYNEAQEAAKNNQTEEKSEEVENVNN